MEAEADIMDIFNEDDFFPFHDLDLKKETNDFNFFILPNIDEFQPINESPNNKHLMDGDQILQKITKCEENYNNILQNNLMLSPATSKTFIKIKTFLTFKTFITFKTFKTFINKT